MDQLIHHVLRNFIGSSFSVATARRPYDDRDSHASQVIASINPSEAHLRRLADQGYSRQQTFLILPSSRKARWLMPLGVNNGTSGLEIYTPYAPAAKIAKALLGTLLQRGWRGWTRDRAVILSKAPLDIETLVREITGECEPVFSLALGSLGKFRKLAVQVMRRDCETLGYIKIPLTPEATERIRHEGTTLKYLATLPALALRIPKVLYDGAWNGSAILFQSSVPPGAGPVHFTGRHEEFLGILHRIRASEKPACLVLDEVTARWKQRAPQLDERVAVLCEKALESASVDLSGTAIGCSMAHGDFAPWNTRLQDGKLHVFDWESATNAPRSWDEFHFQVQVASLLYRGRRRRALREHQSSELRACFLLYLVNSLCQLVEETGSSFHAGVKYRAGLLAGILNQTNRNRLVPIPGMTS